MFGEQVITCKQAQLVSQNVLDGLELNYLDRKVAARHREQCAKCMEFHSLLFQTIALAAEIPAEDFYTESANEGAISSVDFGWTLGRMKQIIEHVIPPDAPKILVLNDKDIDDIFAKMIIGKERSKKSESKTPAKKWPDEENAKKFGKIAADKLDLHLSYSGKITDIGKFLLDPDAVKAFESILYSQKIDKTMRRLSSAESHSIENLQAHLLKQPGIIGSIIMGHDGFVLSSNVPAGIQAKELASWAQCAQINSIIAAELLGAKGMEHLILTSDNATTLITDFPEFLLITLMTGTDPKNVEDLIVKFDRLKQ